MINKKFAIIFDDLDLTTIDRNVGLFAQFLADKGIEVEIITSMQEKNKNINFNSKNISITRLSVSKKWPELNHDNFIKYFNKNVSKYFCVWVYRGRPYTNWVVISSYKKNVNTVIKLDSDSSVSKFGKFFITISKIFGINSKNLYKSNKNFIKLFEFIPSISGFINFDSIFYYSSVVLCETSEKQNQLKKYFPETKLMLYPNSIPVSKYKKIEKDFINIKNNKIISVGRLTPIKHFENAIEAFSKLPNNIKDNWTYEIIGPIEDKKYYVKLTNLVRNLKLENKVKIITGLYKTELYKKYSDASIFLLPSEKEGQPNVIVEAMYFKNAIIAKDMPEIKFLLNNKNLAQLIKTNSPEEIAIAIKTLVINSKKRIEIGNNARIEVTTKFNLDIFGNNLLKKIKYEKD